MKRLFKLVFWLIFLTPFLVAGAMIYSIEENALVERQFAITTDQVKRAKQLVRQHDPRKLKEGEIKSVSLNETELNLLASYLLNALGGSATVSLESGRMDMVASVKIPQTPLGQYINIKAGLRETEVLPRFRYLELGKIPVPNLITNFVLEQALDSLYSRPGYEVAEDVVQKVALAEGRMELTYKWHSELTDMGRSALVGSADQQRLRAFQHHLASVVNGMGRRCSLEELMGPLFELASQRAADGDPVADNRAALLVLSAYVNGRSPAKLAPDVDDWKDAKPVVVKSHGRDDLPKHFLTSAGLAVTVGTALSEAIGLFKEVDDSQGGSGFSFIDLLADNAGTRLGRLAVQSPESAERLQRKLTGSLTETDLIPQVLGLPEGLSNQEFKRQYGEVGSPAYEKVVQVIEKRISGSRLYN